MGVVLRPFKKKDFKEFNINWFRRASSQRFIPEIDALRFFATKIPKWKKWNKKYIKSCRIVAETDSKVVGFAVLAPTSKRDVYKGVAEVSVYVSKNYHGRGIGEKLLRQLIVESEIHGFWTLQAGIFSENIPSIKLHEKCGFKTVGIREKIGQLNGKWHDNHFIERRSKKIM